MDVIRLSSKGQIVIPSEIRARHQWRAGTELVLEEQGETIVLRQATPFAPTEVEAGIGCTGYRGPAKRIEEMDAGIDVALRRDWGTGDDR